MTCHHDSSTRVCRDAVIEKGLFYGGSGKLLGWQLVGIISLLAWAVLFSTLCFGSLCFFGMLRVTDEDQATMHVRTHPRLH